MKSPTVVRWFSRRSGVKLHFFALSALRYGLVLDLSQSYEFIEHIEQSHKQL